jgi:hypothetical protein
VIASRSLGVSIGIDSRGPLAHLCRLLSLFACLLGLLLGHRLALFAIEVITDYPDGAPQPRQEESGARNTYVEEMRETIRQTGMVPREESLPPELREEIVAQFRTRKRG